MKSFLDNVMNQFSSSITDEIFLMIQNDRKLMKEYLDLVSNNNLKTVNQQIGKRVKLRFNLTNDDIRQNEPKSTLIQSHQIFE